MRQRHVSKPCSLVVSVPDLSPPSFILSIMITHSSSHFQCMRKRQTFTPRGKWIRWVWFLTFVTDPVGYEWRGVGIGVDDSFVDFMRSECSSISLKSFEQTE